MRRFTSSLNFVKNRSKRMFATTLTKKRSVLYPLVRDTIINTVHSIEIRYVVYYFDGLIQMFRDFFGSPLLKKRWRRTAERSCRLRSDAREWLSSSCLIALPDPIFRFQPHFLTPFLLKTDSDAISSLPHLHYKFTLLYFLIAFTFQLYSVTRMNCLR